MRLSLRVMAALALPFLFLKASAEQLPEWQLAKICPQPAKPLSSLPRELVDAEVNNPISEGGISAQLNVASAFAQQTDGAGSQYCLRYEVMNLGPGSVPLLYWPLPGIKSATEFPPSKEPVSIVKTVRSANKPVPAKTELYAFKSQMIDTQAFQAAQTNGDILQPLTVQHAENAAKITLIKDDNSIYPEVGAEFTAFGADVGAKSTVTQTDDNYYISIDIGRNSEKLVTSISAPYVLAVLKLEESNLDFLNDVSKDYVSSEIPLDKNVLHVVRNYPIAKVPNIYLIQQPVKFALPGKDRQICFLVPTYSPVEIPDKLQSCGSSN